jgi:hypothetical protein
MEASVNVFLLICFITHILSESSHPVQGNLKCKGHIDFGENASGDGPDGY